jgi:hypothetical protein
MSGSTPTASAVTATTATPTVSTVSGPITTTSTPGMTFPIIFMVVGVIVLIIAIYNVYQMFKVGNCDFGGTQSSVGLTLKIVAVVLLITALGMVGSSIASLVKATEGFDKIGKKYKKYYH